MGIRDKPIAPGAPFCQRLCLVLAEDRCRAHVKASLVDYDRRGCVWRGLRSAGVEVVASRKPAAYNDEKDADYKPQPYKNLYLSEPLALFGIRVSLDIARILLGAERTVEPNARFE